MQIQTKFQQSEAKPNSMTAEHSLMENEAEEVADLLCGIQEWTKACIQNIVSIT